MKGQFYILVILCLLAGFSSCKKPGEKPNILLIMVDDMADWTPDISNQPRPITPNIDRMARQGLVFSNAYCVSPICGPSRASMLTGLRPETSGVYNNLGTYIDYVPDAVAMPEYFRQNGYYVMGAGKINHASSKVVDKNWDEYGPGTEIVGTPFTDEELLTTNMDPTITIDRLKVTLPINGMSTIDRPNMRWSSFDWGPLPVEDNDMPDGKIALWAEKQLGKEYDKPFFMAVGFYKPHQPLFAPQKYFDLYDDKEIELPPYRKDDLDDLSQTAKDFALLPWTAGRHRTVTKYNQWEAGVLGYMATISFVDAQVGRVLDALKDSPNSDNTWVILASDHGWHLGEKDHWGKHTPWQRSTHIPFIVIPPGQDKKYLVAGSSIDEPLSLLDLYPTLIDITGIDKKKDLEGRSFLTLLKGKHKSCRDEVVCTIGRGTHSVKSGKWKYIRYYDGSVELYDLETDPEEWDNLAAYPEYNEIRAGLSSSIIEDKRFERFVRCGRWKVVFETSGNALLFNIHEPHGISEQNDVAEEYPQLVEYIRSYISENNITARRVIVPEQLKIVAFGNSTTAFRSTIDSVYSERLEYNLNKAGIIAKVYNEGVGGSHTGLLKDNNRHNVKHGRDRIDSILHNREPDILIISFGINDSWIDDGKTESRIPLNEYKANLQYMIEKAVTNGVRVILMSPNALGSQHTSLQYNNTSRYAELVRVLADKYDLALIDQWKLFEEYYSLPGKSLDDLLLDGTHPNDIWHRELADNLLGLLKTWLVEVDANFPDNFEKE